MKLNSVRIENFKCIDDSEEFSLKKVTCFVGKNESGKTAILQAIYKLNGDILENSEFKDTEYPRRYWSKYQERHETSPDNVLTTKWLLEEGDIAELDMHFGSDVIINKIITRSRSSFMNMFMKMFLIFQKKETERSLKMLKNILEK